MTCPPPTPPRSGSEATSGALGRRRVLLLELIATLVVVMAVLPAFDVGFLADDFYVGREIQRLADEAPDLASRVTSAFTHRWTAEFDVFRPLTLLTIMADHGLHGPDGRAHHLTNVLLWVATAWAFAFIAGCVSIGGHPLRRPIALLLFGLYPAGVESLGWLVAREDLLMALLGLLAVGRFLARPGRPLGVALFIALAFLAKETAVVLPPLLLWLDLTLQPCGRPTLKGLLRRHTPTFGLLLVYLLTRLALFDSLGTTYSGHDYAWFLFERPESLSHLAVSLGTSLSKLLVPVNTLMLDLLEPTRFWRVLAPIAFLVPAVAILTAPGRTLQPGLLRVVAAAFGWVVGPILLLAPVLTVGPGLSAGRMLVLPAAGWLLVIVTAWSRARSGLPRILANISLVALILASAATLQLNLLPWVQATDRVERVLVDLTLVPPGAEVAIVGVEGDALTIHRGAWVLSPAGVAYAAGPPFMPGPGRQVRVADDPTPSSMGLRPGGNHPRPWILRYLATEEGPRLGLLARPGTLPLSMEPDPGFLRAPGSSIVFRVGTEGLPPEADAARVVVVEPGGYPATRLLIRERSDPHGVKVFSGEEFTPSLTPRVLDALAPRTLIWWVEALSGEDVLERTDYGWIVLR